MQSSSAVLHLLRFHLRAGGRVALRMLAPIPAALVAGAVLYGSPVVVVGSVGKLFCPPRPSLLAGLACLLLAWLLASWAAPRISLGIAGWLRHLPATGADQRRAACAAMVVSQAPIFVLVAGSGLLTGAMAVPVLVRVCALPLLIWAACLARLVGPGSRSGLLALTGGVLAGVGWWWLLAPAVVLVAAAERRAGAPLPVRVRHRRSARLVSAGSSQVRHSLLISLRALGWRILAALLGPAATLLAGFFFLRNNQPTAWQADCAIRLAGATGMVLLVSMLAEQLMLRRPPWPWSRSLPWSAAARVTIDAALLAALALVPVAAAAGLRIATLVPLAAALPYLALRSAAAIRSGRVSRSGAAGPILGEGMLIAVLVAVLPWSTLLLLLLIPLALRLAIRAEQGQSTGLWQELVYLSAGDPLTRGDS
jgi:hypothetical protein